MGFYDEYRAKMECGKTIGEKNENDIINNIRDNFYSLPNVETVYINFTATPTYDVQIKSGNISKDFLGYKTMISYPYDNIKFSLGDYIHWSYGGENTIWLLLSLDRQNIYDVKGRIFLCNRILKIEISSTKVKIGTDSLGRPIYNETPIYLETPCVYIQKTKTAEDSDFAHAINIPQGSISIDYRYDSSKVVKNGMFFEFDDKQYIVNSVDESNVVDDIGYVNILAKEVTIDENA